MKDPHVYYPDKGWQWKWIIAAVIITIAVDLMIHLVMQP